MKDIAFHPYIYMIVHSCKTKYLIIFCEILTAFKMYLSIQYATKLVTENVSFKT